VAIGIAQWKYVSALSAQRDQMASTGMIDSDTQMTMRDFVIDQLLQNRSFTGVSRPELHTVAIVYGDIQRSRQEHLEQLAVRIHGR
jgi:hypothetical protein